jgi:hypothetical protein
MSNAFDEAQRKIKELEALRPSLGDAAVDAAIAAIKAQIEGITGTATVSGTNYGQNVGVNTGTASQNPQNINNTASNQGAQGVFNAPTAINHGGTTFNQQGQNVGTQHNAGRDLNIQNQRAGGNISNSPQISGSGNSYVGGGVHGTGIAIGHKAQAQVQQASSANDLAQAFAHVYAAIDARRDHPDVDKAELTETVQKIEAEAEKGDAANETKLTRWFTMLAGMAEDIVEVTAAALLSPQAAVATVARKVAEKAKAKQLTG